ncbi:unnamed protein product [Caenorhabditis auriculariae]|uniref:MARVEL domain-containing protein n=1 Tax=Caenorhabditis auriculariae TaxID=2777116 RepID=A0A8S1HRF8_9PELO|nr:unnamed protein product [Caenorhabditis auriculariae]
MSLLGDNSRIQALTTGLLLLIVEIIVIISFGGGWSHASYIDGNHGAPPPLSTLIPFPTEVPGWFYYLAINQIIALAFGGLFLVWVVAQLIAPDQFESGSKKSLLVNFAFSVVFTILLFIAFILYASSFKTSEYRTEAMWFGYCFWLAVVDAALALGSTILTALLLVRHRLN